MFLMPSHPLIAQVSVGVWGGRELNRIHATHMRECD